MKNKLNFTYSLEIFAALLTIGGLIAVFYTFIIGKHYVIPTMILTLTILMFNLAYFGFRDKVWAKHVLFWVAFMICAHTFFALFWAHKPREILGSAFLAVYGPVCLVFGVLAWKHAVTNRLFSSDHPTPDNSQK